jgi:catabolite regulation protein CreA
MDDECYKALVARAEKLGCTVINLLIGSDDFASHIEIEDLDDPTVKGFEPIESVNMILPPKNVPQG